MRTRRNIGFVLLAIWLIVRGLLELPGISIARSDLILAILAILAIAAGVLILLGPTRLAGGGTLKLRSSLGMTLLSIWLILTGLLSLFSISIPGIGLIMAILAIAAGILILIGR
jgi:hypothetical protein